MAAAPSARVVGDDPYVAKAAQLLTVVLHCKQQARELQTCADGCARARAAFTTCANEHAHSVVQALVKIASARCPAEVARYEACITCTPGAKCEEEDLAALRCASLQVLLSAGTDALEL